MTDLFWLAAASFVASLITFFSGFGLGTILTPVMMLFFPAELAVAATGLVHLSNNFFKLILTGKNASADVLLRFAVPAILAAVLGSWLMLRIPDSQPLFTHYAFGSQSLVYPLKFLIGLLLILFALLELIPFFSRLEFPKKFLPLGGFLSGFFGGLAGVQGALRTAFLIRAGLSKEAFIATAVVASTLVDLTRLSIYASAVEIRGGLLDSPVIWVGIAAAIAGAALGNQLLKKVTVRTMQVFIAGMLIFMGMALASGLV